MNLDDLRQRFRQRCIGDLERLLAIQRAGIDPADAGQRTELVAMSHRLSGSGGIFGFHDVSDKAGELETLLIGETVDPPRAARALDAVIAALRRLAAD